MPDVDEGAQKGKGAMAEPEQPVATANPMEAFLELISGLFKPTNAGPIWSFVASTAGRALILLVLVAAVVIGAEILRGPVTSRLVVAEARPVAGMVYALPRTMVKVSVLATVDNCRIVEDAPNKSHIELSTRFDLNIASVATADERYIYAIDQSALGHPILPGNWHAEIGPQGTLVSVGSLSRSLVGTMNVLREQVDQLVSGGNGGATADGGVGRAEAVACAGLPRGRVDPATGVAATADGDSHSVVGKAEVMLAPETLVSSDVKLTPNFPPTVTSQATLGLLENYAVAVGIVGADEELASAANALAPDQASGVIYRYPVSAQAVLCWTRCKNGEEKVVPSKAIAAASLPLLLPGNEAVASIVRGWFGDRKTSLSFGDHGGLSRLTDGVPIAEAK